MGKARKARTARKVKTTVVNVLSYSDPSSTSQSHANSVTKSKRAGELRVEADAARTKRTRFLQSKYQSSQSCSLLLLTSTLIAQTSGVRAAANAVVTVSGAQADDDAPAYGNGAFGYEDDLGWEDDDDEEEEEEELEITHAGGEVRDLHVHVVRYMARPGYVIQIYVPDGSQCLLNELQSYSQEGQSNFAGEACSPRVVNAQLEESDGSSRRSISGVEGRGL